jgi:hypothetical protein
MAAKQIQKSMIAWTGAAEDRQLEGGGENIEIFVLTLKTIYFKRN